MIFRTMALAGSALLVSTWANPALAASAGRPIYAIVRVGSALADEDKIGVRRAGLACLPNGVIRWGDVGTGGAMDQREVVQDALEDAGLPVTPLGLGEGTSGRPALRLRARVQAADFRLCAKNYLGNAKAYSGDVMLDIEWRVESMDGSEMPHLSHVTRHIEGGHAASLGSIYRQLLGDAARDIAHWLMTPQS